MVHKSELVSHGPGTSLTVSNFNANGTRGQITGFHKDGISLISDLATGVNGIAPASFPGDPNVTPLDSVYIRWLPGGQATTVARYQNPSGGSSSSIKSHVSFSKKQIAWHGTELKDNETPVPDLYKEYNPDTQRDEPALKTFTINLVEFTWLASTTSNPIDATLYGMINKVNNATYTLTFDAVSQYTFSAGFLRFNGAETRHRKVGASDTWLTRYWATFSPIKWLRSKLKAPVVAGNDPTVELEPEYPSTTFAVLPG